MTYDDFTLLQDADIEPFISMSATQVAFKSGAAAIASQVKTLQKAASKLPSYHAARCILPKISYEQSTSEAVADSRGYARGNLAIDLTCGLGVDSFYLSKNYKKVIAIELDPLRADIARHNFKLLQAHNIEVVTSSAEDFLADFTEQADLIFIDPARRDDTGNKVYSIEDSSPNVLHLLPILRKIAPQIIIKLSPLFDIDECFRLFGADCAVEIVSHNNECKEVVVKFGMATQHKIINTIIGTPTKHIVCEPKNDTLKLQNIATAQFLYVPDVAFYKSRTVEQMLGGTDAHYQGGYVLTSHPLENFHGRGYKIQATLPYHPKNIKKILAQQKIKNITIHQRLFPYSNTQIHKELATKEGNGQKLFFSMVDLQATVFFVTLPL